MTIPKLEVYKEKIEPLINVIKTICKEEGFSFITEFELDEDLRSHDGTGDMILDYSTIMTNLQRWKARNNRDNEYLKEVLQENKKEPLVFNINVTVNGNEKSTSSIAKELVKKIRDWELSEVK